MGGSICSKPKLSDLETQTLPFYEKHAQKFIKLGLSVENICALMKIFKKIDFNNSCALVFSEILLFIGMKDSPILCNFILSPDSEFTVPELNLLDFIYVIYNFCSLDIHLLAPYIFSLYDKTNRGSIEKLEMTQMLFDLYELLRAVLNARRKSDANKEVIDNTFHLAEISLNEISYTHFIHYCKQNTTMLYPLVALQRKLQTHIGENMWKEIATHRTKLCQNKYVHVNDMLHPEFQSVMNNSKLVVEDSNSSTNSAAFISRTNSMKFVQCISMNSAGEVSSSGASESLVDSLYQFPSATNFVRVTDYSCSHLVDVDQLIQRKDDKISFREDMQKDEGNELTMEEYKKARLSVVPMLPLRARYGENLYKSEITHVLGSGSKKRSILTVDTNDETDYVVNGTPHSVLDSPYTEKMYSIDTSSQDCAPLTPQKRSPDMINYVTSPNARHEVKLQSPVTNPKFMKQRGTTWTD